MLKVVLPEPIVHGVVTVIGKDGKIKRDEPDLSKKE